MMTDILDEYLMTNTRMPGYILPTLDCNSWGDNNAGNVLALQQLGIGADDEVLLYRGTNIGEFEDMQESGEVVSQSWTTNIKTAELFAYDYYNGDAEHRCIIAMVVLGSDMLGCIDGREEDEVILAKGCGYEDIMVK